MIVFIQFFRKSALSRGPLLLALAALTLSTPQAFAGFCDGGLKRQFKAEFELKVEASESGKISVRLFKNDTLLAKTLNGVIRLLEKPLKLDQWGAAIYRFQEDSRDEVPYFAKVREAFRVKVKTQVSPQTRERFQNPGPAVFYSNHPLSGVEGIAFLSILESIRPDIKAVMASPLKALPGLEPHGIFVDVFGKNQSSVIEMNRHLKKGGALFIFPAGEVSGLDSPGLDSSVTERLATDLPWKRGIARMMDEVPGLTYFPVFVEGQPSTRYLKMRRFSPLLSNVLLFNEMVESIDKEVSLVIGKPFLSDTIKHLSVEDRISYFRGMSSIMGGNYFRSQMSELDPSERASMGEIDEDFPLVSKEELRVLLLVHGDRDKLRELSTPASLP